MSLKIHKLLYKRGAKTKYSSALIPNKKRLLHKKIIKLENPDVINYSRIKRIAIGSGSKEEDVRELLKYYKLMKTASKQLRKRRDLERFMKRIMMSGKL